MQELRLVAVSEDGTYVVLAQPGRATVFTLPNDERLRAVVRGQFSRLAQYEIEVESPLRPKEIQARIRSGETAEQIADTASVPIERVRWFEGPVLAERAYVAQQAQAASVRLPGDPRPGPQLGEIVTERLRDLGVDPEEAQWDSRKRGDGSWLVELTFGTGAKRRTAAWVFDPRRRHAMPEDDEAARLSLPVDALEAAGLIAHPDHATRGRGTVTPFVPRSNPAVPRPTVAPDSELASLAASESAHAADSDVEAKAAAQGRRNARPPEPQPSPSGVPQLQPPVSGTHRPQAAGLAEPLAAGRAAPHGPGQAAAHGPGQAAAHGPGQAAAHGPGQAAPHAPAPRRPPVPAAGTQRQDTPQHSPAAAAGEPSAVDENPAAAETPPEPPARDRSARKAAGGRSRRSSVPTWDEIMFGSSRRQD